MITIADLKDIQKQVESDQELKNNKAYVVNRDNNDKPNQYNHIRDHISFINFCYKGPNHKPHRKSPKVY